LSATPNGKNHIRKNPRGFSASLVTRRDKLSSQKTLTASARRNHRGPPGRIPPRSHNSLLHNCPSTSATSGQVTLR